MDELLWVILPYHATLILFIYFDYKPFLLLRLIKNRTIIWYGTFSFQSAEISQILGIEYRRVYKSMRQSDTSRDSFTTQTENIQH